MILEAPDKSVIFVISGVALALSAAGWLLVRESPRAGTDGAARGGRYAAQTLSGRCDNVKKRRPPCARSGT